MSFFVKNTNISEKKYKIICALVILIALASWIFNLGWWRIILTWIGLPVIHLTAFGIINNKLIPYINKSPKIKTQIIASYITCILAYILFPDFGDADPQYMFFNLIRNEKIIGVCFIISIILFLINIIVLVLELISKRKIKKEIMEES